MFQNTKREVTFGEKMPSKTYVVFGGLVCPVVISTVPKPMFSDSKLTNSISRALDFGQLLTTEMVKTRWLSG